MEIIETSLLFESLPTVMPLLNTTAFMWIMVIFTLALLGWLSVKFWHIHSIPKSIAKDKNLAQAKLIFWLCMLGLIWKPLWILAVLAIVIDWTKIQQWIKGTRS